MIRATVNESRPFVAQLDEEDQRFQAGHDNTTQQSIVVRFQCRLAAEQEGGEKSIDNVLDNWFSGKGNCEVVPGTVVLEFLDDQNNNALIGTLTLMACQLEMLSTTTTHQAVQASVRVRSFKSEWKPASGAASIEQNLHEKFSNTFQRVTGSP
ncbi:MAG TPA: hypothetical protein VHC22_24105 [Pirellulales bacterium]|nr:hypothetical protein [Pirellulales bacterium]